MHRACPEPPRRITATIIETVALQVGFRIDKGLALACFRVKQIKSVGGRNNQPARRTPRQTTHRLAKIKAAIHARCRIKPVNEPRLDINPPQAGILCIPYRPSPSRAGDDTAISISTVIYRPSSIVMACPTELSGRAPSTLKNRAKSLVRFWLIGLADWFWPDWNAPFLVLSDFRNEDIHEAYAAHPADPQARIFGDDMDFSNFKLSVW